MNRSALVLAGARQSSAVEDKSKDGLLTAEEARSLDLDGTQLVVLSACDTGQGETASGQGVYGLRRAFLVAGAETVVTSLWRVHDEATGELMSMYYGKLLDKQHPGDRLAGMIESMKELRARPGREHPYYWAPFLVIGSDGPLRQAPAR
jgi:CHAT domain-containing protein